MQLEPLHMSSTSSNDIDMSCLSNPASGVQNNQLQSVLAHYFPAGILAIIDRDMRILTIAGKWLETSGLSPDALVGKTLGEIAPVDIAAELADRYRSALAGTEVQFSIEYRDSSYGITATPLPDDNGAVSSLLILAQSTTRTKTTAPPRTEKDALRTAEKPVGPSDNTECRDAEKRLQESNAMLTSIIESTGDSVFALDREYRYITYNNHHQAMMSSLYGAGFIRLGEPLSCYMTIPSHLQSLTALVDRALQGEQFLCEIPYPMANEQNVAYKELTFNPIRSNKGDITGVAIFARNITEEKRAEERIKNSEQLLKSINANISEGLYRSTDGTLLYANQAFADLFGFSSVEEALADTSPMLHADIGQQKRLKEVMEQEGRFSNQEVQFVRKDGSLFWALVSSIREYDDKGNIFYDGAITDITERMQVQEALSRSYEQLELRVQERTADLQQAFEQLNIVLAKEKELSELKSRFVSMVSHEFRTPLTSILSSVEILDRYWQRLDKVRIQRFHFMIKESVAHMSALLDDVILLGQAEAGRILFRPVVLDPAVFCRELIEELQSGVGRNRTIHFSMEGASREVSLDPTLLRHILANLLINAVKYSDSRKPVSLTLIVEKEELILEIADQGIGISPEDLEHIFEPFYRSKQVETIPGTGLGLSIVKQSVARHGGSVQIHSEIHKGTMFTIRLPL
jgi:PAS domain S-box-containing protein